MVRLPCFHCREHCAPAQRARWTINNSRSCEVVVDGTLRRVATNIQQHRQRALRGETREEISDNQVLFAITVEVPYRHHTKTYDGVGSSHLEGTRACSQ